jgi:hypothetical protein
MAAKRDPYLRGRVDKRRLSLVWLPAQALRRRVRALEAFRASLAELNDE